MRINNPDHLMTQLFKLLAPQILWKRVRNFGRQRTSLLLGKIYAGRKAIPGRIINQERAIVGLSNSPHELHLCVSAWLTC